VWLPFVTLGLETEKALFFLQTEASLVLATLHFGLNAYCAAFDQTNLAYIRYKYLKKQQFIHNVNDDGSKQQKS